jgi:ribonuclease D
MTSEPTPLLEPRDGLPEVITDSASLERAIAAVRDAGGPVAMDAERASGYRYGQRAYLVQLRRAGAGTFLIDPIACPDLAELGDAIGDAEVILHAATQDLPCLAEVGLEPRRLFDTELAGRLLGYPRVGLGTMVETVLGFTLEKGHSAADWSTRPLPEEWLRYAALDVELLIELRDRVDAELHEVGKHEWAEQEFAAILAAPPKEPRADPWRRTSGIHRVRNRRGLAVVRSLWTTRDEIAQDRDLSPGRVLPDSAIVDAAMNPPESVPDLARRPPFRGRNARPHAAAWFRAFQRAQALPDTALPEPSLLGDGPPPAHRWSERDPAAAARLAAARGVVNGIAEARTLPAENVVQPDSIRRLAWAPPAEITTETVAAALAGSGVRPWQVSLVAEPLATALTQAAVELVEQSEPPGGDA